MKAFKKFSLFLLILFGWFLTQPSTVSAQVPERPRGTTVLDQTGLLSPDSIRQIDAENQNWQTTDQQLQVAVLFLESLSGQDLETLSNETFRRWRIGFSGTNNGVLVVVALQERAFRIETSDQAATILTDVEAKTILDASREFFRAQDYDSGLLYIVDAIGDHFYGTDRAQSRLEELQEESSSGSERDAIGLIILVGIVFLVFISQSGGRGGRGGGGGDLLWLLLANSSASSSRSGGSSFGRGNGGWSGGGGGGGGASSGW